MADGATLDGSALDGSDHTTSLALKETGKLLQQHAISLKAGGKITALGEKHQRMAPEKVADPDMKPDKEGPPDVPTALEESQEWKIIQASLDRITWLISSILEVVEVSADKDDLSEVRSALLPIASRWKDIGIELKPKPADLDTMQAAHPYYPEDCLKNAVSQWLRKGYSITKHGPPTWSNLVYAMLVDAGGKNTALAKRLVDKHQGMPPEKVSDPDRKSDKQEPPDLPTVFEECQECNIIRTNLDRITQLISSDLSRGLAWFAQKLEEKAFIANAADAVVLGYTSYQQTSRLISAVKGKISTSQEPEREFSKFIEILESNPQSVDFAKELRVKYGKPITRSDKRTPDGPNLTSTGNGVKPAQQSHQEVTITKRNYQMIRKKFASLLRRASNRLQTKGISIEDLLLFLEAQYSSENSKDGSDFAGAVTESSSTIGGIFRAIGKQGLWSYWDYFLLQSLVDEFASDDEDLQANVTQYGEELTGFIFTTTIESYLEEVVKSSPSSDPEKLPSPCPDSKPFSMLSVKLDRDITKRSLDYIRQLWKSLGKKCRLPLHTILLQKVEEGCICITWMIPFHLMPQLVRGLCDNAAYFKEQHILWASVDGVYLYKEPGPQLSDFPTEEHEMVRSVGKIALFAAAEHGSHEIVDLLLSQSLNPNMLNNDNKTALDVAVEHQQWEVVELLVGRGAMSGEGMPEMLHEACRSGDVGAVTALLSNGVNVDSKNESDKTPLMVAAQHGHKEVAQLLLSRQVKVNAIDKDTKTALDVAVEHEQWDLFELLVGRGAMSGEGMPEMLHEACRSGDVGAVTALLSNGVNVDSKNESDKTPLMVAAEHGHKEVAQLLLTHQAKVNAIDKDTKTALDVAVDNEQWEVVDLLVESGAVSGEGKLHESSIGGDLDRFIALFSNAVNSKDEKGITQLIYASAHGDTERVEVLLKAGAKPDLQSNNGMTALMAATNFGHSKIVDSLLKAGANPNLRRAKDGATALLAASQEGHTQIVDSLLKAGANPNLQSNDGATALMAASREGHSQIVDSLLKAGANPDLLNNGSGYTALLAASATGHTQIVDSLLKAGANPNLQSNDGASALIFASREGHTQIVDSLLKAGANPDFERNDGATALMLASRNGHTHAVDTLLKAGANPDLMNSGVGVTALRLASQEGHTQIVDSLLKAGANPDLPNKNGETALKAASIKGHTQVVDSLLKAGAKPDLQSKDGYTALMLASCEGHTHVVESLLKAGAKPDLQDKDVVFIALMLASKYGHTQTVESLLRAGAKSDLQNKNGTTALFDASDNGHTQVVDSLLKAGAKPDLQNKNDATALMAASQNGHTQIVNSLLKAGAKPDLQANDGTTALLFASQNGHSKIVDSLLNAGAKPDLQANVRMDLL